MKEANRFRALMTGLGELYGKEITQGLSDMYWAALSDYSDQEVDAAIKRGIRKWRCVNRIPSPAEIIEEIMGTASDQSLAAWEQLQAGVHRAGTYQSVHFEDGKMGRVIQLLGGWEAVCQWPMSELQYRRKEFMDAYKALPAQKNGMTLAGLCDRQNAALGYAEAPPVTIPRQLPPPEPTVPMIETAQPAATKPGNGHDTEAQIPVGEVLREMTKRLFKAERQ